MGNSARYRNLCLNPTPTFIITVQDSLTEDKAMGTDSHFNSNSGTAARQRNMEEVRYILRANSLPFVRKYN